MYPKYTGKCLTPEMEVVAEKWISEKKGHMVVPTLAFNIKDAQIYPLLIFDEKILNYFISTKWRDCILKGCINNFANS